VFAVPVAAFVSAYFLRAHSLYIWGTLSAIGGICLFRIFFTWAYGTWLIHQDNSQNRAFLKIAKDLSDEGFEEESNAMILLLQSVLRKRIERLKD
jgi:hypothetical protein